MVLKLADWILDVDISLTMEISAEQARSHCECGYCRNFYHDIDRACPELRTFMAQFGIDITAPDELCPFEPTIYEATYVVQGSIVQKGSVPLYLNGIPVYLQNAEDADLETAHPMPYFTVTVGLIELQWVLDEPMQEVVSPANDPEYLLRMQRKLLDRLSADEVFS